MIRKQIGKRKDLFFVAFLGSKGENSIRSYPRVAEPSRQKTNKQKKTLNKPTNSLFWRSEKGRPFLVSKLNTAVFLSGANWELYKVHVTSSLLRQLILNPLPTPHTHSRPQLCAHTQHLHAGVMKPRGRGVDLLARSLRWERSSTHGQSL